VKLPTPFVDEPAWPAGAEVRVVFLLDASSGVEAAILRDWVARARPPEVAEADVEIVAVPPSRRRRRRARAADPRLEAAVAASGEALFAPLRVAWRVPERDGVREVRWRDLVTSFGDPRDPGALRQRWTLGRHPERCRIVAGAPALLADLRERWTRACGADDGVTLGLADFVARQAALALDRAERRMRGARYKVPRFVHEDILARPAVRGGLARIAREQGRPEAAVLREAGRYLAEIAATHSPFVIDLAAPLIRALWSQGYRNLRFDRQRLEAVAALGQRHSVVFLPSHKSNLDHLVLQYALHVCGLPPNHTAGGINMNFFPVGPLVRRSGVFFIRRTFKDNPVYKFVLRQYVDFLIEKRFPLEWYVEGGRSRSGKLLPPRFGLLSYVVDAWRRGKAEDVYLIPVSIAYDQISDVGDYAAEQRGGPKERESFGWFVRVIRRMRRRYGDIHLRFGEALSLRAALARGELGELDHDAPDLAIQKLAFEVCARINRVTPITPTSLVTLTLLGAGNRALSVDEIMVGMRNLLEDVRRRKLHTTRELEELEAPDGVRRALDTLRQSGVVSCFAEGPEAVFAIGQDQHHAAAYYRNSIAHFFVNGAIAELALLRAAEVDGDDPSEAFWAEALRLRDMLKFEFFFADRERFRAELRDEMAGRHAAFEERLRADGGEEVRRMIRETRPYGAHRVLRPFLDAYLIVADTLSRRSPNAAFEAGPFLEQALRLGRQYLLQRRVRSPESVSKTLFETGLRLARNRGLVEPGPADLAERRRAFAAELRDAIRRVEIVEALAAARRAGMTP
jgi:glycerol-3-phosphate O-acyltransferase